MAFTEENQNFFRLYYVLNEFGTKALNELLRWTVNQVIPSATTLSTFLALPQVHWQLCSPRTRGCLDPMQKDLLYPSGTPSTAFDYGDLDITLVTTLLKHLTVFSGILTQPQYGPGTLWTNPTEHDQDSYPIEAHVVLLKNKRNSMAHFRRPSLPVVVFDADFDEVKSYVMFFMKLLGSVAFDEDDIERYRDSPLSPEVFQETAEKLLESLEVAKESRELKNEVRRLIEQQAQMEGRVVGLAEQIERLTKKTTCMMVLFVYSIILNVVCFVMFIWNIIISDRQCTSQVELYIRRRIEELKGSCDFKMSTTNRKKKRWNKQVLIPDIDSLRHHGEPAPPPE